MFFFSRKSRKSLSSPTSQLGNKLVKEAWWLGLALLGSYLSLVLASYSSTDSAWSIVTQNFTVNNLGGRVGAQLADFLLSIFGFSAWWLVVLCLYTIRLRYLKFIKNAHDEHLFLTFNMVGFILLLLSSSLLEAGHLIELPATLPQGQGGMLGALDEWLYRLFGYVGTTMLLIVTWAVGFSLFTSYSWLAFIEGLGGFLIRVYCLIVEYWQQRQDRKIGRILEQEREQFVEKERQRQQNREPLHIEPPSLITPSVRIQQEKQAPLFEEWTSLPPIHLLDKADNQLAIISAETLEFTSRLIERKLMDFGIEVKVLSALPGPVITRYEFEPSAGVKGAQVISLARDLARALSVVSVRLVETIPGKTCMGLELPNSKRQIVRLCEILGSAAYANVHSPLTIALGKDISGNPVVADLAKMPHVLVAGTTGSGKSVAINALILSILYKADPHSVRMILIDPKMLELSVYEDIPHLLAPVVTDMRQAANALNWCVTEMERRYRLMSALGVRNLAGYNQKIKDDAPTNPFSLTPEQPEALTPLPFIVVVIDELADLMMVVGKKVEELIARLAQKARASGIHLVLATQRPSVDVITGLIKANIPTRVAFQVSSKIDSRTILDQMGAEALLGQGDMLYLPPGSGYPQRVHGAFVSDNEVHKVVHHLKSVAQPNYLEGILTNEVVDNSVSNDDDAVASGESDKLYDEAVALVIKTRRPSISLVQRHLRIGYNRAARLIEEMERAGLVSAMQSNGNREVLVPAQQGDQK